MPVEIEESEISENSSEMAESNSRTIAHPIESERDPIERKIKASADKLSRSPAPIPTRNLCISKSPEIGPFGQLMYTITYPGRKKGWYGRSFGDLIRSEFYPSSVPKRPQMMRHMFEREEDGRPKHFQVVLVDLENEPYAVLKLFRRLDWYDIQLPQSVEATREFLPGEKPFRHDSHASLVRIRARLGSSRPAVSDNITVEWKTNSATDQR